MQERELERVGGEETLPVDVRIVAATNTPADALLASRDFREDLYYRLHMVPITIPPLRNRPSDIRVLVHHFIEKLRDRTCSSVTEVSEEVIQRLIGYRWPGNIRELENMVERALVLADGPRLELTDLPPLNSDGQAVLAVEGNGAILGDGLDLNTRLGGVEEKLIRQAMEQAEGVKAEAARLLGVKPSALYYKLEKYGIEE